jgi:uncharacterized protein involved in type VI secretion and phage assembly
MINRDDSESGFRDFNRQSSTQGRSGAGSTDQTTNEVELHFECNELSIDWVVEHGTLHEELGQPYRIELTVSTPELGDAPSELLGKSCLPTIERGPVLRHLHGIIF